MLFAVLVGLLGFSGCGSGEERKVRTSAPSVATALSESTFRSIDTRKVPAIRSVKSDTTTDMPIVTESSEMEVTICPSVSPELTRSTSPTETVTVQYEAHQVLLQSSMTDDELTGITVLTLEDGRDLLAKGMEDLLVEAEGPSRESMIGNPRMFAQNKMDRLRGQVGQVLDRLPVHADRVVLTREVQSSLSADKFVVWFQFCVESATALSGILEINWNDDFGLTIEPMSALRQSFRDVTEELSGWGGGSVRGRLDRIKLMMDLVDLGRHWPIDLLTGTISMRWAIERLESIVTPVVLLEIRDRIGLYRMVVLIQRIAARLLASLGDRAEEFSAPVEEFITRIRDVYVLVNAHVDWLESTKQAIEAAVNRGEFQLEVNLLIPVGCCEDLRRRIVVDAHELEAFFGRAASWHRKRQIMNRPL